MFTLFLSCEVKARRSRVKISECKIIIIIIKKNLSYNYSSKRESVDEILSHVASVQTHKIPTLIWQTWYDL